LLYAPHVVARGHHRLLVCAALLSVLVAMGCGGSGKSSSSSAGGTSAAASTQATQAVQTAPQLPGRATSSNGTGLGATAAAWTAAHAPDSDFAAGSAYDKDPSLADVEGHTGARYTGVGREGGRIVEYAYHFPSAPIAVAKRHILTSQFPADTHVVAFGVRPTCAVMLVRSATLQRELSRAVGHPAVGASVRFNGGPEENSYDANAVTTAVLGSTAAKSPADVEC
jgi:hypothetical protein